MLVLADVCALSGRKVISHKIWNPTKWGFICEFHHWHGQITGEYTKNGKVIISTWAYKLVTKPEEDPSLLFLSQPWVEGEIN